MSTDERRATPSVASQFDTLQANMVELRDGQHELLCMYEELRDNYPVNCLCARMRQNTLAEVLTADPFAPEANHEDYVPGEPY